MKIRINRNKVFLDVYHKGKRRWENTGLTVSSNEKQNKEVMRLAEVLRSTRETQIVSGEYGLLDPVLSKKTLYQYATEKAELTSEKHQLRKLLKYIEQYPGGSFIQLNKISAEWVGGFQSYLLKETELSQGTASRYFSALKHLLNMAVRENLLHRSPAQVIKGITVPETEKVYLAINEIQALANTALPGRLGAEVKKGFLFACFTGLRISDIRTLAWGDIERQPLQIKKRQQKTKRFVYVPLNNNAWAVINDGTLHKHDELVFPFLGTTRTNTNQYLMQWATNAGLEKQIGWHTARHTFATLTLESGADFFTVSKLLGHTKTVTTAVYLKATDKLTREAVNALPDIVITKAGGGA